MKFSIFYFLFSKFCIIILFSIFYFLFSGSAWAATLYLEPSQGEYRAGDTFLVEARINTDECVNAIEANLKFPQDILEAIDFSSGNSILTLWPEPPKINQEAGLISFSGGTPGGYCGKVLGDPGESNLFGKIVLRARETDVKLERETNAKIEFLETSQVLLNDGLGTPARLTLRSANFTILTQKAEIPKNEWLGEIVRDTIPPEPFEIKISQDQSLYNGKYFISFFTTDKQIGIDHYEIKEGWIGSWKTGLSPYFLADQSLRSIIKVKAIDKAGNARIAQYIPPKKPFPWKIVIILILLGIGIIWLIWKKYSTKFQWLTH